MRYEEPLYRPPVESRSLIIQATIGCPHNRCTFCAMYKGKRFRVRPLDEIKADILEAGRLWPDTPSVFLADGNSVAMKANDLVEILDLVKETFPGAKRISSYGGARFLRGRKPGELERLREHGLDVIYMGLESGDDEVLRRVNKGVTSGDFIKSAGKVREAGITLSTYVLAGLGGRDRTKEHAVNSAHVLNAMNPDYIRIRTLVVLQGTPLHDEMENGCFEECSGREIALETRLLLSELDVKDSMFLSDHVSNYMPIHGRLPGQKEQMIRSIDEVLKHPDHPALQPRVITSL